MRITALTIFFSHKIKKIRKRVCVSESSCMEKNYGQEGVYHVCPSIDFFLSVPKNSEGSPSVFRKNPHNENYADEGGVASQFIECFCLTVLKKFVGGSLVF